MKKTGIFVIVGILVIVLIVAFSGNKKGTVMEDTTATEDTQSEATIAVKEFTVSGANMAFSPNGLVVNKGDTVRIVFDNTETGTMMHDFVIDEFDARTNIIKGGEQSVVEFVADKAGTFVYYCSVGNHREQGMVGTILVVE